MMPAGDMSLVKYTAGAANDAAANVNTKIDAISNVMCFMLIASCKFWDDGKINVEAEFTSREICGVMSADRKMPP